MDRIPHRRLSRGVVLVRDDDLDRVLDFVEPVAAELYVRQVALTEEDREVLGAEGDEGLN